MHVISGFLGTKTRLKLSPYIYLLLSYGKKLSELLQIIQNGWGRKGPLAIIYSKPPGSKRERLEEAAQVCSWSGFSTSTASLGNLCSLGKQNKNKQQQTPFFSCLNVTSFCVHYLLSRPWSPLSTVSCSILFCFCYFNFPSRSQVLTHFNNIPLSFLFPKVIQRGKPEVNTLFTLHTPIFIAYHTTCFMHQSTQSNDPSLLCFPTQCLPSPGESSDLVPC